MIREIVTLNNCENVSLPLVTMSNGITIRLFDPYDMINANKVVCQLYPDINKLANEGYTTICVPATKPIPIAWHLALICGLNLVVFKKECKPYHKKYLEFSCKSITSDKQNTMFIDSSDYEHLNNQKVIFFDDVLSTGATWYSCKTFLKEQCHVKELFSIFVFKEGDTKFEDKNIKWLGEIPI